MKRTQHQVVLAVVTLGMLGGFGNRAGFQTSAFGQGAEPQAVGTSYKRWKVIRATIASSREVMTMAALRAEALNCAGAMVGTTDYAISGDALAAVREAGITYVVTVEDLEQAIAAERAQIDAANQQRGLSWFAAYKDYDQISGYVNTLIETRPDLASRFSIGASLEGRDMFGIRITSNVGINKPGIFLHGLTHAREWVTGMTAMYIADRLVREYDSNEQIRALVDHFEVYIVPVTNPDGYVYTWSTPQRRLWRKNRRHNDNNTFGVDINRNWGHEWGPNASGGSSGEPNSETYRGTAAFSEPETQRLRDFAIAHPRLVFHVDIHSYGQLVLSPWGYTSLPSPDATLFDEVNTGFVQAIEQVHNFNYTGGPTFHTIYPANGVSQDWLYAERGILSWGVECRNLTSFDLPPVQILPNAQEMFSGISWVAEWLRTTPLRVAPAGAVPEHISAGEEHVLAVRVERGAEQPDPASVDVYARVGLGGAFALLPASPTGEPGVYQATLPDGACGETVQFYVRAESTLGSVVTWPREGAAAPFSMMAVNQTVVMTENAEMFSPWVLGLPGDTATAGQWVRGDPNGTAAQPENDHSGIGTRCFFTGQGLPGGQAGAADVDGGFTTLMSPPIDLQGRDATISYWRWYSNATGANPNEDVFRVGISNNDGGTWTNVHTVGPNGPEANPGWFRHEFRVTDFIAPTAQMRVRFMAIDAGSSSVVEAAIDEFLVTERAPCPPLKCPADWNADGTISSQDFFDFVTAFFGGNADFNGDDATNSQDFFDFVGAFFSGC